ncbi:MAG TPA: hypothetical protein VFU58_02645 [Candidatus Nitrosotalea sp.]|nr:hypothetical protein [Candidatus Nitrosotalea sp.]
MSHICGVPSANAGDKEPEMIIEIEKRYKMFISYTCWTDIS